MIRDSILLLIDMDAIRDFVILCGEVGHYSKENTGNSIVDAYFGPDDFAPEKTPKGRNPIDILHDLGILSDRIRDQVTPEIRAHYLLGEVSSLSVVMEWLSGECLPYKSLVKGLFGIEVTPFPDRELVAVKCELEEAMASYPGKDLRDKVERFNKAGLVSGDDLKQLIENELPEKTAEVRRLFTDRVYSRIGEEITDHGVVYKAVTNEPWSGYNYYQGEYRSVNCFNIDRPFNRDTILSLICHEYEHHVSNLWRERSYRAKGYAELSIVPLHTGRCVISEGTADTAEDFLGLSLDDSRKVIVDILYKLRRMVSINAALKLNHKKEELADVIEYIADWSFRSTDYARSTTSFIRPNDENGLTNLWAPYVFTYFIGRTEYVLPTFKKAQNEDELDRFFREVYLNPFSSSSMTWEKAFSWL